MFSQIVDGIVFYGRRILRIIQFDVVVYLAQHEIEFRSEPFQIFGVYFMKKLDLIDKEDRLLIDNHNIERERADKTVNV